MRVFRHEDFGPTVVATFMKIATRGFERAEFAVRPGRRIEAKRVHAGDRREVVLKFREDGENTLNLGIGLPGVRIRQSSVRHDDFARFGTVLHGAGSERVEAGIDAEILPGERDVMANEVIFRQRPQVG